MITRGWRYILVLVSVAVVSTTLVIWLGSQSAAGAGVAAPSHVDLGRVSYLYRFDPSNSSFGFTFTLPTDDADLWDVATVPGPGHQEVWFTEAGADRIGRLIYTHTASYTFQEYTLTVGSRPLNLVPGGGFIWFTEAGRNRIGRLNPTTGQVDEFSVPTPNSYPADLDRAPDGSIWFTEMAADRVGHLVITSTNDLTVTEYYTLSHTGGQPYGIIVAGESLYFARTMSNTVTRFTMPTGDWVDIKSLTRPDIPNQPYKLALNSLGQVWGTERAGNRVSLYAYGTFPDIDDHPVEPPGSQPTGIAVDPDNKVWFTQWAAGQIGRLNPGMTVTTNYYPLPLPGLAPTGIAVDSQRAVWVVASQPHRVYLPIVQK